MSGSLCNGTYESKVKLDKKNSRYIDIRRSHFNMCNKRQNNDIRSRRREYNSKKKERIWKRKKKERGERERERKEERNKHIKKKWKK